MTDDCRRGCVVLSRWLQSVLEGERYGATCMRLNPAERLRLADVLADYPHGDDCTPDEDAERNRAIYAAEERFHRAP